MKDLLQRQIDKQTGALRDLAMSMPPNGWIQTIRKALGMTRQQLGKIVGVTKQSIEKLEHSEAHKKISIEKLETLAQSMGCQLIYAFVPHKPISEVVEERIAKKAAQIIRQINHTMALEEQSTQTDEQKLLYQKIMEDLKKKKRMSIIWEDECRAYA